MFFFLNFSCFFSEAFSTIRWRTLWANMHDEFIQMCFCYLSLWLSSFCYFLCNFAYDFSYLYHMYVRICAYLLSSFDSRTIEGRITKDCACNICPQWSYLIYLTCIDQFHKMFRNLLVPRNWAHFNGSDLHFISAGSHNGESPVEDLWGRLNHLINEGIVTCIFTFFIILWLRIEFAWNGHFKWLPRHVTLRFDIKFERLPEMLQGYLDIRVRFFGLERSDCKAVL